MHGSETDSSSSICGGVAGEREGEGRFNVEPSQTRAFTSERSRPAVAGENGFFSESLWSAIVIDASSSFNDLLSWICETKSFEFGAYASTMCNHESLFGIWDSDLDLHSFVVIPSHPFVHLVPWPSPLPVPLGRGRRGSGRRLFVPHRLFIIVRRRRRPPTACRPTPTLRNPTPSTTTAREHSR